MPNQGEREAGESIALRAFAVLEQVAAAPTAMSLDEITHAMALPKPTVFRILNMLHKVNLLRRESISKRYVVGPRLTAFAADLWRNASLRNQWRRALEAAVKETGESCNLTLLEGNEVLYLDRVETDHPLRMHLPSGTRVPLHCTASGKLLLSRMPIEKVKLLLGDEPYKAYTAATITDFVSFERELKKVRKSEVGTHDDELFSGSVAIAVPVSDARNNIYAAVALHAPSSRGNLKSIMRFLPSLRRAAESISSTLTLNADLLTQSKGGKTVRRSRKAVAGPLRSTKGLADSKGSKLTGVHPGR